MTLKQQRAADKQRADADSRGRGLPQHLDDRVQAFRGGGAPQMDDADLQVRQQHHAQHEKGPVPQIPGVGEASDELKGPRTQQHTHASARQLAAGN